LFFKLIHICSCDVNNSTFPKVLNSPSKLQDYSLATI
jgi:hypothetical protein